MCLYNRQKLQLAEFKLNSLLEITQAINANRSAHDLLEKYREILCDGLNVGTLVVFSVTQGWKKLLQVGLSEDYGNDADEISSALLFYTEITKFPKHKDKLFAHFDVIIPVYHKREPLAYVLLGQIESSNIFFKKKSFVEHLRVIQILTNIVVVALENKRLYRKALEQESLKKELEVASNLQAMLIPSDDSLPQNDYIKIASFYQPHSMVGGDYYDFMQLNESEFGFCIADVSGKGISAAILMSNFQANLRILFKRNIPLINLVKELNQNVNQSSKGDRFVTFFIGKYDCNNHTLHYINAGHNPPLLLHRSISKLSYLTEGCVGLGMLEEIPTISVGSVHINSGDSLICYTDGLVEAENCKGEPFGTIPIEGAMTIDGNADDIVFTIRKELEEFLGLESVTDDVSIMGVDFL